jgi:hydroxyethylthiazole kinase-like uncharacterized protein yjeF
MRRSPRGKPQLITDAQLRRWPLPNPANRAKQRGARPRVDYRGRGGDAGSCDSREQLRRFALAREKFAWRLPKLRRLRLELLFPETFVLGISDGAGRDESFRAIIDSARNADAVLIGPGMRDIAAIRALLPELLAIDTLAALVLDASAMGIATEFLPHAGNVRTIVTPHAGEMASILAAESPDAGPNAPDAAKRLDTIVVLKGEETLICSPDGSAYLNKRGNVGLATAGSGDVLAGIITGLCARGADPLHAAAWAVSIHARAGEKLAKRIGPLGYLARELVDEVPALLGAGGTRRSTGGCGRT